MVVVLLPLPIIKEGMMVKASLRERILKVAREVFFEKGYYGTTTREIAQRAQTSESGVFRIFSSKYEILMSVYNLSWKRVNDEIDSKIEEISDPKEKIIFIVQTVFELYDTDKICMSFIIMNTGNTDTLILERKEDSIISKENTIYIERIQRLCEECFLTGGIHKLLTAQSLCEGIISLIEGILLGWYLADNSRDYPYRLDNKTALNMIKVFIGEVA